MPVMIFLVLLVSGIILCISSARHYRIRKVHMTSGVILIILALSTIIFTFNLETEISQRTPFVLSESTTTYELVSLKTDTEISGTGSRHYLEISEKTVFNFYYKTTKNGKEGFAPKTIIATDVFIDETYESSPVILEIKTTYAYPFTEFEEWWFQDYIHSLDPYTVTSYEIYVPAGSIVETYNLN